MNLNRKGVLISGRSRSGLTLPELLVLCCIAGLLIILLVNAIRPRPMTGGLIKCISNLKNLAVAAQIFATDNNDLFPGITLLTNFNSSAKFTCADYFRFISN